MVANTLKALLLAAGKATRLGELSRSTPKCLLSVGEEVILDRIIRQLSNVGVTEFLINTHHLAEKVIEHIEARHDRDRFTLVHESTLLGTLGTLRENLEFFSEGYGWVMHADNFITGSLEPLERGFLQRPEGTWGGMLTFRAENPSNCGVVETTADGVVTGFWEKPDRPPTREASAATFIFGKPVFEVAGSLPPSLNDISADLLPRLIRRMVAVPHEGRVIDIGTPTGLRTARSVATQSQRASGSGNL